MTYFRPDQPTIPVCGICVVENTHYGPFLMYFAIEFERCPRIHSEEKSYDIWVTTNNTISTLVMSDHVLFKTVPIPTKQTLHVFEIAKSKYPITTETQTDVKLTSSRTKGEKRKTLAVIRFHCLRKSNQVLKEGR